MISAGFTNHQLEKHNLKTLVHELGPESFDMSSNNNKKNNMYVKHVSISMVLLC